MGAPGVRNFLWWCFAWLVGGVFHGGSLRSRLATASLTRGRMLVRYRYANGGRSSRLSSWVSWWAGAGKIYRTTVGMDVSDGTDMGTDSREHISGCPRQAIYLRPPAPLSVPLLVHTSVPGYPPEYITVEKTSLYFAHHQI
ncbi:hypothetical protein HOY82DRAFT_342818 [Tuber indicum]|nr:hypothetical protein HOY82DRAFT_342818 [Tuber indicum]